MGKKGEENAREGATARQQLLGNGNGRSASLVCNLPLTHTATPAEAEARSSLACHSPRRQHLHLVLLRIPVGDGVDPAFSEISGCLSPSMMPWSVSAAGSLLRSWFRDYERIQGAAVVLLYLQIGCALVGSLGALYNGLLLIHLILALFALIAIESNSQNLGRTYAALLACGMLLDIMNMSSEKYGHLFVFSLRLTLWMQIIGFSMRILSSLLWIQMYRLGVSSMMQSTAYMEADSVARNFLNPPANDMTRQNSNSNFISGGSIYHPAQYSSLLEDAQEKMYLNEDDRQFSPSSISASRAQPSELKP
ncbi:hypothetical protein Taro_033649 [Colocasia esculenta]|uniref:Uncharacterized protein n=1 Tax=Colocasia esculenta TaxID=4460 RepID=A0A843VUD5_COLES|nr:hypothetical protein [Colocasia esculenta]